MPRAHLSGSGLALLALALFQLPLRAQGDDTPADSAAVRITYLANEGFLIAGGGKRVLIDALFSSGVQGYPVIPPDVRARLEAGEPPFGPADLILATHHHADHFDPAMVAQYLERHPDAYFVSTEQALERLRRATQSRPDLMARARGLMPAEGQRVELAPNGVGLTLLNLHHGRHRSPPVQNLGFLIEIGGVTLLHVGDTEADARDLAPYALADQGIDLALVPSWFLTYEKWRRVVEESIRPTRVIVMHLPTPDAPASWFGNFRNLAGLKRAIVAAFPDAVFLEQPGEGLGFSLATHGEEASD